MTCNYFSETDCHLLTFLHCNASAGRTETLCKSRRNRINAVGFLLSPYLLDHPNERNESVLSGSDLDMMHIVMDKLGIEHMDLDVATRASTRIAFNGVRHLNIE